MKTASFLFFLATIFLMTGCSSDSDRDNDPDAYLEPVAPPKKVIFTLCDFTRSTSSSRENLKRNIADVLTAIPANTKFLFYQIGDRSEKAFINETTLPFDSAKSDHKRTLRIRDQKIADSLYDHGNSVNYTCISKAINMLQQQVEYYQRDTSYKKIYIVILSDMLENCNWGDVYVNLENDQYKEANDALDKDSLIKFSNTDNLDISIVLSSGSLPDRNNLYKFWQAYFTKMGYAKSLMMGNDLPEDYFMH